MFGISGGGRISGESNQLSSRIWQGTSDAKRPMLPGGLRWYPNEADWQNLAESRLHGKRKEFTLSLKRNADFGVDADLSAVVKAVDLKIGGKYRSCEHVEFSVTGSF
jgi:hypothetical protein